MVEGRQKFLRLSAVGVNGNRLSAVVGIKTAQNVPLRIQQKGVHPLTNAQVADIVSDHAVEPSHPIPARKRNLGPEPEVVDATTAAQRRKLFLRIAKADSCGR